MADKQGLSRRAYEPIPPGEEYDPYVSPADSPAEFTAKAVFFGIVFGILFGAANAYLGLRVGLTISTSIPVAVLTVAAFRAMALASVSSTLLEANQSQTVGSASSSVASGVIFTLPALFMWGFDPTLIQMTLLALCGGLLGVLFMIPLRRFLIAGEHGRLPYPEGTACAEVLVASEIGGARAKNVFLGLGAGALFKLIFGWLHLLPHKVTVPLPVKKGEVASEMSAALLGVGYILGPRIAAVMVGGGLLSWVVIIPAIAYLYGGRAEPLYPETALLVDDMTASQIWNRYVRYIGAGAVATAGLITLIKSLPTMIESFKIGSRQLKKRLSEQRDGAVADEPRTQQDLPLKVVGIGAVAIALTLALVPQAFAAIDSMAIRAVAAILVVTFAFFFVTVSSRIVGLVGVTSNPTSGMTIATLLATSSLFLLAGWTDDLGKVAALTVGCVVAIAASIAGDTSQDLKTGFLLGATPRRQQIGELFGVLTSAKQPSDALHLARYLGARDKGLATFAEKGFEPTEGDVWLEEPELTFFCGSVNRRAVEPIIEEFEQREGVRVNCIYNGCGILTAQMQAIAGGEQGGGFPDTYMACDVYYLKTVEEMFQDAVNVSDTEVVIAVAKGNPKNIQSLQDLTAPGIKVSLGQPDQCTIGILTRQLLESEDVYDAVMENVVTEVPSSAMLVPTIVTGSVDATLAFKTDTLAESDQLDVVILDSPAAKAVQPFSIARSSDHKHLARRLYRAIASSRDKFETAGFHWRLEDEFGQAPQ